MTTATCKRRSAGSYEYRGRRIDKTPSEVYGDSAWHISSINGEPIDVADTLREAKAMVDRMGPLRVVIEMSTSGPIMYRHISPRGYGELRRYMIDDLLADLRFIYGECIEGDMKLGNFSGLLPETGVKR